MTVNWDGVIATTNATSTYLKSLPDGIRTKLIEAFKILGNANLEPADKVSKVDELIKGVQDEKAKVESPRLLPLSSSRNSSTIRQREWPRWPSGRSTASTRRIPQCARAVAASSVSWFAPTSSRPRTTRRETN